MDAERFQHACALKEEGRLSEAYNAFAALAEQTSDKIDRAAVLVYEAQTLKLLGRIDDAYRRLNAARSLVNNELPWQAGRDDRLRHLEVYIDYEDADLNWLQGSQPEHALAKFETTLNAYSDRWREPDFSGFFESMEGRRAFILADLGRWRAAKEILETLKDSD